MITAPLRPIAAFLGLLFLQLIFQTNLYGDTAMITIEIKDHLFFPSRVEIPAHTKVKLLIINRDNTAEEFESYELNREKIIPGGAKAVIFIGPLQPGEYPFFGEFFPKTAQGKVIAR